MKQTFMSAKILALVLILIAVAYQLLVFSFGYGYSLAKNDIRFRLEQQGIITPLPTSVSYVVGNVQSVNPEDFSITAKLYLSYDPLFDVGVTSLVARARLTSDAQIVKRVSSIVVLEGQSQYTDIMINLVDIKAGDQIGLVATENILSKDDFQVSKVILLE